MELIDKAAVVAEIEKLLDNNTYFDGYDCSYHDGNNGALYALKNKLDTLEVKEVDLNESARHYLLHEHISPLNEVLHQVNLKVEMQYHKDIEDAYKAGFMLGLKTKKGE